jgi:hypothetical protein
MSAPDSFCTLKALAVCLRRSGSYDAIGLAATIEERLEELQVVFDDDVDQTGINEWVTQLKGFFKPATTPE